MPSSDEPAARSSTAIIRRIPRSVTREQLDAAIRARGQEPLKLLRLHAQRQCIVEFDGQLDAERFVAFHSSEPLVLNGKELPVCFGDAPVTSRAAGSFRTHEIMREVTYAVDALVRRLATDYAEEMREARRCRRSHHKQALKRQRITTIADPCSVSIAVDAPICWRFVESGGFCPRGKLCQKVHDPRLPLSALPVERRFLMAEDSFRPAAETTRAKSAVNTLLAGMSTGAPSRRCFLLDGPSCRTVRALSAEYGDCVGGRGRRPSDFVVPNVVTASYASIAAAGSCIPFHGSARLCMEALATGAGDLDSHGGTCLQLPTVVPPHRRFGLIFLDYCCRLDAGRHQIEKSPIADIKALFSLRLPHPGGCLLAVTLADDPEATVAMADSPDTDSHDCLQAATATALPVAPAPERLRKLVAAEAAHAGLECCRSTHGKQYAGGRHGTSRMFFEIFGIGEVARSLAAGPRVPPGSPQLLSWQRYGSHVLELRQKAMHLDQPDCMPKMDENMQHFGIMLPEGVDSSVQPARLLSVLSVQKQQVLAMSRREACFGIFCTDPAWQRQGLCTRVLSAALVTLAADGVRRVCCTVQKETQEFCSRLGFIVIPESAFTEKCRDYVMMEMALHE